MHFSESGQSIIASAPNQNRDFFDDHLERLIPYFAARALNRIVSLRDGTMPFQLDMWNSFGHPLDQAYRNQTRFDGVGREEYSTLLIDEKYKFLEEVGIDTSTHKIIRDDEASTRTWILGKLKKLYDTGAIYEDTESVSVCGSCGIVIAAATSRVTSCGRCSAADISVENRETLFLNLPVDKLDCIRGKIDLPRKADFINGQFVTLPERVMVARQRDYGQPLGIPGYEDMVLDPKIGLALMPEMIAEQYGITTITQVQGVTTAKNTTPYTAVLSPDLSVRYIFTGNVPRDITVDIMNNLGVNFFKKYLPIFMLGRTGNVNEAQLQQLAREHSKTTRKFENAMSFLKLHQSEAEHESSGNLTKITSALGSIAMYDIRSGVLDMKRFVYEELGARFINDLREHKSKVSARDLSTIDTILEEIF